LPVNPLRYGGSVQSHFQELTSCLDPTSRSGKSKTIATAMNKFEISSERLRGIQREKRASVVAALRV